MLKRNKEGRVIILTTHFMDEADILGDRIGIMASGKIKCCGSSLFLKKRYGVGYNLVIAKVDKQPSPVIDQFIESQISEAIKLSEVSSEVVYQIPQSCSSRFESFFEILDKSLDRLGIKFYGVGVTTLEEVFLSVGRDQDEETEEEQKEGMNINSDEERKQKGFIDEYAISDNSVQGSCNIFMLHFQALSTKRWLTSIR